MPAAAQQHNRTQTRPGSAAPRRTSSLRWTREIMLFLGALVVYQVSRALVIGDTGDAIRNAWAIIDVEKATGIFFESSVQGWLLDNLHVAQILNHFYVWAHIPVTALFFVWLYRRRNTAYRYVRNSFFVANAVALSVFVIFPVAPPRLIRSEGFTDTLSIISGIDLHAGQLSGWFNPFAAVPSMHFGYALMVGVIAFVLLKSWPLRIVALFYPVLVFITIVGTANHYVLDAIAGGAVMMASFGLVAWVMLKRTRRVETTL